MDSSIRAEVLASEVAFLESLSGGSEQRMSFADSWESTLSRVMHAMDAGALSNDTIATCQTILHRVNAVATGLHQRDEAEEGVVRDVINQTRRHLSESCRTSAPQLALRAATPSQGRRPSPNQTADKALAPYRRWFLDHFSHPYLSAADKEQLVREVPSQSVQQASTWLIK